MEEKNIQKREKANTVIKIVNAVLCVSIIASVCVNVYQYKESSTLRSEIVALQSEMETLETDRDTLNKEIETKQNEESDLAKQIEDLQKKIEQLVADNQSLADSLRTLEDGINSTHTDVELGEDEYQGDEATDGANINLNEEEQAAVNRIEENLKKKHPEWFTDTAPSGTGEGNYEHVGTPDNTENTPQFQFDPNDTEGLSKDVTVY